MPRGFLPGCEPDGCAKCPLKGCIQVPPEGNPHAQIAIVGMGPGRQEERRGQPFCGDSGDLLNRILSEAGLNRRDLWISNVAACMPGAVGLEGGGVIPKGRVEKDSMLRHCRGHILRELGVVKPRVVIALGTLTAQALTDDREGITQIHGSVNRLSTISGHNAIVIPLFHPAHLLRGEQRFYPAVLEGFRKAKALARDGFQSPGSLFLIDPQNAGVDRDLDRLDNLVSEVIASGEDMAVDVETTSEHPTKAALTVFGFGLASKKLGVSITIRTWNHIRGTFEWLWSRSRWQRLYAILLRLWRSKNAKLFWNWGFDVTVGERFFGPIGGRVRDGMILHHLDYPDMLHRLDFAVQTLLCVEPWKYIYRMKAKRGEATHRDLLVYNGQDCLYTALVFPLVERNARQRRNLHLENHQLNVSDFARRTHIHGIPINQPAWVKAHATATEKRDAAMKIMREAIVEREGALDELARFVYDARVARAPAGKVVEPVTFQSVTDWNPNAADHARWYLYEFLRLQPTRMTKGGPERDPSKQQPSHSYKGVLVYMSNPLVKAYVDRAEHEATLRALETIRANIDPVTGRLHPSWLSTSMKGTRWTSHPNCFDAKTEILTTRGWVPFPELRTDDKVAQWSNRDDSISFVKPTRIIKHEYTGSMLAIKTRSADLCVTSNHRLLLWKRRSGKVPVMTECLASELPGHEKGRAIPQAQGAYKGGTVIEDPAFITVLAAAQADGWRRKYGPSEAWAWYFRKQRKVTRLVAALQALGTTASWYSTPLNRKARRGKSETAIYLRACPLKDKLDSYLLNGREKDFAFDKLLTWSPTSLAGLVAEVRHWDGSSKSTVYASVNRHNADCVQIAALLGGVGRVGGLYPARSKQSKRDCWLVQPGSRLAGFSKKHLKWLPPQTQTVYCVSVPSSYIVVRRNTKVAVTGNCQNWDDILKRLTDLRGTDYCWIGADAAQIEFRISAFLAAIPELLNLFNAPAFDEEKEEWKKYDARYDGHSLIATEVFGDTFTKGDKKTKKALRTMVKRVVYALFYGAFPEKIYQTILEDRHVPSEFRAFVAAHPEYIERIHSGFSARFPEWDRFAQREILQVRMNGEQIIAPFNRHRPWALCGMVEETKIRNTPIQLSAGEVINALFLRMDKEVRRLGIRTWFAIHGHDACEWVVHRDDAEKLKVLINKLFDVWLERGDDISEPARVIHIYGQAKVGDDLTFEDAKAA